jgi:multidrug resistance protein, MATE family
VAQLASIAMMVIDTLVVGHHSTEDLAAVAIGSSVYVSLMLGLAGIIQALGPVIAHDFGAERHHLLSEHVRQGFWLALGLAVPGSLLLLNPAWIMELAGVTPDVAGQGADYLKILAWCLPASLVFRAFHATANAMGQPRALMIIGSWFR